MRTLRYWLNFFVALTALIFVPNLLAQIQVELNVGEKAPDFSLLGSDGNTYTLTQFKGKSPVVIAFFPKAFTTGCTLECKTIAESKDILGQYQVAYFMASVDAPDLNKQFAESHEVTFPILSDPDKTMAPLYGVMHERGFTLRWTFYIDSDGIIQKIDKEIDVNDAGKELINNFEELGFKKHAG